MTLAGSGRFGQPRVPQQPDLRTKRAITHALQEGLGGSGINTTFGHFADLPAPGNTGNLAYFDDVNIFARDNGTSWDYFGPSLSVIGLPNRATFAWLNQGSATVDLSKGIMVMTQFGNGGSNAIAAQLVTPAFSAPISMFVQVATNIPASTAGGGNNAEVGIFAWDSVVGKGILWGPSWRPASGMSMEYQLFTSTTSAVDGPYGNTPAPNNGTGFMWLGYQDTGVNRKLLIGNPDGNRFAVIYQEASNATGGTGAAFTPNKFGIGINPCTPATGFQLSITTYSFTLSNS